MSEQEYQNSMVFYRSFIDAIDQLPIEDQALLYKAIIRYAIDDQVINLQTPMQKLTWTLIKPQLDANKKRRKDGKKGASHGKKGGRPKKENNPSGVFNNNPTPLQEETPNVNKNVECIIINDNEELKINNENNISTSVPPDFLDLTDEELKSIKSQMIKRNGTEYPVTNKEIIDKIGWCFTKGLLRAEFTRDEKIDVLTYVIRRSYPADYGKRSCIITDRQVTETINQIVEMRKLGVFKESINKAISESYKAIYPLYQVSAPNKNNKTGNNDNWKRTNNNTYGGKF